MATGYKLPGIGHLLLLLMAMSVESSILLGTFTRDYETWHVIVPAFVRSPPGINLSIYNKDSLSIMTRLILVVHQLLFFI